MRLKRLIKRRAVGEIVAALILILIAGILGSLLFTISLGSTNQQSKELKAQLDIETESTQERFNLLYLSNESSVLTFWIQNYGKIDIKIVDIYIDGVRLSFSEIEISVGEIAKISGISFPSGVVGPEYKVVIISSRGVRNVSEWVM
jgi:hypothetical protein